MKKNNTGELEFRKSSYCQGCFACVETAFEEEKVHIRNSQDPSQKTITFSRGEWSSFVKGVKAGEFNLL